tara:strand:- start:1705 stop:1941 length:237 start_codon:yes stop_codon:yes gene_type:complete
MTAYKVWVKTINENVWHTNAVSFATEEEAKGHGKDLHRRWLLVEEWEVRKTDDCPTHTFTEKSDGYEIRPIEKDNDNG